MKKLIVVIGPRRSGLHAVCNWLIGHFPGRVRFVNDPDIDLPPRLDAFLDCFEYEVSADKVRLQPTLHLLQSEAQFLNLKVANTLPRPWNWIACWGLKRIWRPRIMRTSRVLPELDGPGNVAPDIHIVLLENLSPAGAAEALPAWLAAYRVNFELPPVERETIVIVLRSPWNCLASTLNHPAMNGTPGSGPRSRLNRLIRSDKPSAANGGRIVSPRHIGEIWAVYAKEIIGASQHLKPSQWQVHPLLYDTWLTSPELRASIAANLGRPPDDRGLSLMATHGGGSSFDGPQGVASSPQELTSRWRYFQHHPDMRTLLASPEIHRLAHALGMAIPGID